MIPVISVVGKSNSGKTTLLEKLIPEISSRGLRVAAVKHDAHSFDIDHEGKDSYRLFHSGAEAVLISSPAKYALIRRVHKEWRLDELVAALGDGFDLVLTEGYKGAASPKIEVIRSGRSSELICSEDQLIAVATDMEMDLSVPAFHIDDVAAIADFVQTQIPLLSNWGDAINAPVNEGSNA